MSTEALTPTPLARPRSVDARPRALSRLTAVEVRKTLDTRAARWLVTVAALMSAAGLGYRLLQAEDVLIYPDVVRAALAGVQPLLPVVGILAMTSEWTQRTALTTFTLVPQRGRVVAAKLAAVGVLTAGSVLLLAAVAAATTVAGSVVTGDPVEWGDVPRTVGGTAAALALSVLMGTALGALLQQTQVAVVAYLVAPPLVVSAARELLDEDARWVDVYQALAYLAELELDAGGSELFVPVGVWVLLPLLAGVVRSLRRDVG